jgi:hypothetical protein
VGHNKVLIHNPEYKGKGRTESASSNPTPRLRRRPPIKIRGLPGMMEFFDDEEEEKEELSNELVASLKQNAFGVNQQDDFGVLRKATTSKLKRFAKALGDSCSTMLHLHRAALEKFGNNFNGIRIRSCLLSIKFPFSFKNNKIGSPFYSTKLEVGGIYYISLGVLLSTK